MATNQKHFARDLELEIKNMRMIKAILGNYFITKDIIADQKEATDFMTLTVNPFRVGVRLRRYNIYKVLEWRNQFTIRWWRPSGVKTEIHKIREGLVDYILYGFTDETEQKIIEWFLGDLKVFRDVDCEPIAIKPNNPRDSDFAIFDRSQFPANFICAYYPSHSNYTENIHQPIETNQLSEAEQLEFL